MKKIAAILMLAIISGLLLFATGNTVAQSATDIKINEIMFDPLGDDAANEWIELYNNGTETQNINGWTISNRDGTTDATLPDWDFPCDTYLVVHFGTGTNDNDFSDGNGHFYTGETVGVLNHNTEDECALYSGTPDASAIIDFVSWCSDGSYSGGTAHDYAVSAGIWTSGNYFNTGFPTGKSIWDGISIGRDKSSTDTDQPDNWDSTGGVDAYYPTSGARNTGPLYSIHDGIKLTQLQVNMFLVHWEYQVTYSNHTILEERQTDDETYVKANHYFEANLDGIVNITLIGVGEYHWYKVNSSAWEEEISFILSSNSDLSEKFSMNYTKESVTTGLIKKIYENISRTYSYEVFDSNDTNESIPVPPVRVIKENYTYETNTTITQTDTNRYYTEIIQQVNDRDIIWNVSFVKDELISYCKTEAWTTLNLTNNVEEPHTISTHYNMSVGEGWINGDLDELNVSYQNYTVVFGNKTFVLDEPGYIHMEKINNSYLNVVWNIILVNVDNISETLDLGGSGDIEILNIGGEEIIKGYFAGNTVSKIYQIYIDGAPGVIVGGLVSGGIAVAVVAWWNPAGWVGAAVAGGAGIVGGLIGNGVEPDNTDPSISFAVIGSGSTTQCGWIKIKVTVKDDSDLSNIRVTTTEPTTGNTRGNWNFKDKESPWEYTLKLKNRKCSKPEQRVINVIATDDSANKNKDSEDNIVTVPPKKCPPGQKCCISGANSETCYAPETPEDGCCEYTGGCYDDIPDPAVCTVCYGGTWYPGLHCEGGECVPEFTTIAIPVAAILGLLFLFSRRKRKP